MAELENGFIALGVAFTVITLQLSGLLTQGWGWQGITE